MCLIVYICAYREKRITQFLRGSGELQRKHLGGDWALWGCCSVFNKAKQNNPLNCCVFTYGYGEGGNGNLMTSDWSREGGRTFSGVQGEFGLVRLHHGAVSSHTALQVGRRWQLSPWLPVSWDLCLIVHVWTADSRDDVPRVHACFVFLFVCLLHFLSYNKYSHTKGLKKL